MLLILHLSLLEADNYQWDPAEVGVKGTLAQRTQGSVEEIEYSARRRTQHEA